MRAQKILVTNLALALTLVSGYAMADLPYNICTDIPSCQTQAATGNMEAEYNLGLIYDDGINTKADYTQAVQWYQKAATQGLAVAQYRLGLLYYNGNGVTQDKKMAAQLYQQAVAQGSPYASVELGSMYQNGEGGLTQDYQKALTLYQQAATAGDVDGSVDAGIMYKEGYGVTKDFVKAQTYYMQAAVTGDADAAYDLGLLYYDGGSGVPQDLNKAYAWFATADKLTPNDPDTMRLKGEVFALLPPAQQVTAKALADQYMAKYGTSSN
ncbi:MAG: sel1 repeat family protein [Legionellales bacterium]|nr:sel1 repeat family protein [Legionellales bacterium]